MPRSGRADVGGYCYHVMNRGNGRAEVFHKEGDYAAFARLLRAGVARFDMRLLAFCLMPNHFHLALWPRQDGDLGKYMHWLLTTHVARYHKHYHGSGHIWQGRFKAFPIEEDEHLLAVLRYIERNPLRANLVARAEDWPWSSLAWLRSPSLLPILDPGPVPRGQDWLEQIHTPATQAEWSRLQESLKRGRPFGGDGWIEATAKKLGLQATLRPVGRPRKKVEPKSDEATPLFV